MMSQKPAIVGLYETKLKSKQWDTLRVKLGFQNCFSVDSIGRSGGLALLWYSDTDVVISPLSNSHIDAIVNSTSSFRITLFNGNPRTEKRKKLGFITFIESETCCPLDCIR